MVWLLRMAEDDAIEAIVVFKLSKHGEIQSGDIHLGNAGQMIRRSSDAEYSTSVHSSTSLQPASSTGRPWTSPAHAQSTGKKAPLVHALSRQEAIHHYVTYKLNTSVACPARAVQHRPAPGCYSPAPSYTDA